MKDRYEALEGRKSWKERILPLIRPLIRIYRRIEMTYGNGAIMYVLFLLVFALCVTSVAILPLYNVVAFVSECKIRKGATLVTTALNCMSVTRDVTEVKLSEIMCEEAPENLAFVLPTPVSGYVIHSTFMLIVIIKFFGVALPFIVINLVYFQRKASETVADYSIVVSRLPKETREHDLRHYIEDRLNYKDSISKILIIPREKEVALLMKEYEDIKERLEDVPHFPRTHTKISRMKEELDEISKKISELQESGFYTCSGIAILTFHDAYTRYNILKRFKYRSVYLFYLNWWTMSEDQKFFVSDEKNARLKEVRFLIDIPHEESDYRLYNFRYSLLNSLMRLFLMYLAFIPVLIVSVIVVQFVERTKAHIFEPIALQPFPWEPVHVDVEDR